MTPVCPCVMLESADFGVVMRISTRDHATEGTFRNFDKIIVRTPSSG